ncbi:G-type lectin S-receptor-like serine/threonine-protein kinase B120 [Apostasia shenzhenica]|uniref:non-specific serine/threonine protein kinase n=1 Tax=Apostasia shenzhenica TaxID=1088818 RepID=A0A2I0B7B3_9ASPA|nr:G-type lectin S-receptor-like serine/threonine-protein kinase B120 [Apostasia shenzhenica]
MKFNGRFYDLTGTVHLSTAVVFFIAVCCLFPLPFPHAASSISPGNPLQDGAIIVSPGGVFELGFFSPGSSKNRYLGIWYRNSAAAVAVWVANRESPVPNSFGSLAIAADGNLVILDGDGRNLWSTNVSLPLASTPVAALLDSGNLVLKTSDAIEWQSFEHPTDTYLPGMKVGLDLRTNVNHVFSSWQSSGDPAPGNFTMGMDPDRSTQIVIWENGDPCWRSGRWNGQTFIGVEGMVPEYIYGFRLNNFESEEEMYFYYNVFNSTQRFVLTPDGVAKQLLREDSGDLWTEIWAQPSVECEIYNRCGDYASCSDGVNNSPVCSCLKGFVPQPGGGCRRRMPLQCERNTTAGDKPDGFFLMPGVKLPDLSDWDPVSLNESQCKQSCSTNCSCKAYSFVTGIGCLVWARDLVDIHIFSTGGNDLYLRLAGEELGE